MGSAIGQLTAVEFEVIGSNANNKAGSDPILDIPKRFGLPSLTSSGGVAGCACGFGSTAAGPLAAVGLGGAGLVLHAMLAVVVAPLNLVLLARSFSRHHDPKALLVAGSGALLIYLHFLAGGLYAEAHVQPFIYTGVALLMAGALLDWRARRRIWSSLV